jgi:hypothetical protein
MGPSDGLERVLFTALNQFAAASAHRELANAKLILLGFPVRARFAHESQLSTQSNCRRDPLGARTLRALRDRYRGLEP